MSNIKKKMKKSIKKNEKKELGVYPVKDEILIVTKIIIGTIIIAMLVVALTFILNKEYYIKTNETEISSEEILAGQVFSRSETAYYVVLYNFNNTTIKDAISNSKTTTKIYTVDLSNAMNKSIISEDNNTIASNSLELKVKDTTLIKIENGKNTSYINGDTQVSEYLQNLE